MTVACSASGSTSFTDKALSDTIDDHGGDATGGDV